MVSATAYRAKKIYLEALRVIAIYLVIFNHTVEYGFTLYSIKPLSKLYWLYMFMSIACKVAVPIFFMISGALLLGKEESISTVLKKRELRFIIVLLLFSFLQYIYSVYKCNTTFSLRTFFKLVLTSDLAPAYWYLYAFAAFILMLPLLRKIAVNMSNQEYVYLAILNIAFAGILPIIQCLLFKNKNSFEWYFNPIIATNTCIVFPLMGYFIEHRIQHYSKRTATILLLGSFACTVICCAMTQYQRHFVKSVYDTNALIFYSALILVPSMTVYYCVKYFFIRIFIPARIYKLIIAAGSTTFGCMLIENIIREQTQCYFVTIRDMLHIPDMLGCLIWVALILIICMLITFVIKKIPLLKKLI